MRAELKKLLAFILCIILCIGMFPVSALAEEEVLAEVVTEDAAAETEALSATSIIQDEEVIPGEAETEVLSGDYLSDYPNTWINTGNQAYDIAQIALTQVGYTETDTNHTKYNAWYYGSDKEAEWCAIFVSWCANQAGVTCMKKAACASPLPEDFNIPAYELKSVTPVVGDIVFMENNGNLNAGGTVYGYDHVGIVYSVDNDYIYTVEGNGNNAVDLWKYRRSDGVCTAKSNQYIVWVGKPAYTGGVLPTSGANSVSEQTASQRIDELYTIIQNNGGYFNVDQSTGCGSKYSGHGCNNCLLSNILQATWFKNAFGNIKASQFAFGNGANKSCYAFAIFAGWYIHRANNSDNVRRNSAENQAGTFSKNFLSANAKTGDYLDIGTGKHGAIYISCDDSGVYVLDSNYVGSYNCGVNKHVIPYSYATNVDIVHMYSETGGGTTPAGLTLSGADYPSGHYDSLPLSPSGKPHYGLRGVFTSGSPITYVYAQVLNSAGEHALSPYELRPNVYSYNIQYDGINDHFDFALLSNGSYTYYVKVADSAGNIKEIYSEFSIGETHKHSWASSAITTQPTCTATGVRTYYCSGCSETKTESVAAYGHSWVTDYGYEATCTTSGKTNGSHCSRCGTTGTAQQNIPAKGHSFATSWTSDSTHHWHASTCGHEVTSGKAEHAWNSGSVTQEATYTTAGKITYTCTVCAKTKEETIPVKTRTIISSCTIEVSPTFYTFDGNAKTPTVTVKDGATMLTKDTDYTVSYSNNTNAGTATVTVTGKGGYTGTKTANFTINKANQNLSASVSPSSIKVGETAQISVTGAQGTVTYSSSNAGVATVNSSGLVTGVSAGSATITVNAAGNGNYNAATATVEITVISAGPHTFDPDAPQILVSNGTGRPGKTATVEVSFANNPGITGLTVDFVYDKSVFTLKSIRGEGLTGSWVPGIDRVAWMSSSGDQSFNGRILTLEFDIKEDAVLGTYPISVSYIPGNICNYALEDVDFAISAGSIKVNNHIPGDVNGDGKVGTKDYVTLMKYVAGEEELSYDPDALDINNDGSVGTKDFVTLMKFVAGEDIVIY